MKLIQNKIVFKRIKTIVLLGIIFCGIYFFYNKYQNNSPDIIKIKIGSPISSPILRDTNNLYFGTKNGLYYSIDQKTGHSNWVFRTNGYTYLPSVISNGTIYFTNNDGRLYAIDTQTGLERWRYTTPSLIEPDTQPVVIDSIVYFGSRNGNLYAFNKNNGHLLWTFSLPTVNPHIWIKDKVIIHFGRLYADSNDKVLYVSSSTANAFFALDSKSGKVLWTFPSFIYSLGEPILFTDDMIFINSGDHHLYAIRKADGTILWSTDNSNIADGKLYITKRDVFSLNKSGALFSINKENGEINWTIEDEKFLNPLFQLRDSIYISSAIEGGASVIQKIQTQDVSSRTNLLTLLSPISNFSFSQNLFYLTTVEGDFYKVSLSGEIISSFKINGLTNTPIFETNLVFFTSLSPGQKSTIYLYDREKNKLIKSIAIDSKIDQIDTIQSGIFAVSKEGKELTLIRHNQNVASTNTREELLENTTKVNISFEDKFKQIYFSKGVQKVKLQSSASTINSNTVYEITLTYPDDYIVSSKEDVSVTGYFQKDKEKIQFSVKGFYYDKNTWKIRFIPPETGKWKWHIDFGIGLLGRSFDGMFTVIGDPPIGFLKVNPVNKFTFSNSDGSPFFGIGLQDCIADYSFFGNPLTQLPDFNDPTQDSHTLKFVDLDTYLNYYNNDNKGFTLFRWSTDNCSFKLWNTISIKHNDYGVNEGIFGDQLISALKRHNYKVMMTIFGFHPPFIDNLNEANKRAIQNYLDYVIARYSAYVDIWELTNEVDTNENWIQFVSNYIRQIDPYQHPITTSWEKPDSPSIDINSIHWYEKEFLEQSDILTANKIKVAKRWNKPVIFSEQGNAIANWDPESSTRMRIRAWSAFFNQGILIFWNNTLGIYRNTENANIYLGPTEIKYVEILRKFTEGLSSNAVPIQIDVENADTRTYGLSSKNSMGIYFYHHGNSNNSSVKFYMDIPKEANGSWIDPENGEIFEKQHYGQGKKLYSSPPFNEDVALKIIY